MKASVLFLCFTVLSAVMLSQSQIAVLAACNPNELMACAGAVLTSKPPTAECCAKLKEQQPCFCAYKKNPNLKSYIKPENYKKVAACKVPVPKCWVLWLQHLSVVVSLWEVTLSINKDNIYVVWGHVAVWLLVEMYPVFVVNFEMQCCAKKNAVSTHISTSLGSEVCERYYVVWVYSNSVLASNAVISASVL